MADSIIKVDHYSTSISNKVGEGARVLGALRDAGVNLTALWGYPKSARLAQLELIPESGTGFAKAAKKAGLVLGKKQTAFFVNGDERPGAIAETLAKLAATEINVGAVQAGCGGAGRYGVIVFLPQKDVRKAAKVLGVTSR